jgi:LmbE family N-acetylglucosaminyl deacetylase
MLRELAPLLVLVPHPDDETLGCGGLLATAARARVDLEVVYLTDGSASHRRSVQWPPPRLSLQRRGEALEALGALGVGAARVAFIDWPDAAPYGPAHPRYAETALWLRTFCARRNIRSMFAPWEGEGHCDHQAASALCEAARAGLDPAPRRFDYLVWGWTEPALGAAAARRTVWGLPCAMEIDRRGAALARHRTQLGDLITDDADAFVIPPELAALTRRPTEIFLERP